MFRTMAIALSIAVLAFVVPNEKDPQTTTKVVVQFPTDRGALPGQGGQITARRHRSS